MLAVLYLMCHIDRANIGNAKIEGMVQDLNMTGLQYNTVLSICGLISCGTHSASSVFLDVSAKGVLTRDIYMQSSFPTSCLKFPVTLFSRSSSALQRTLDFLS